MKDLHDRYKSGETKAVEILDRTGNYMGRVVSTLSDILDPGVVAIGGRVDPILPIWLPIIREQVRKSSYIARNRDLMVTETPYIESAIMIGCGEAAFQEWIKTSDISK